MEDDPNATASLAEEGCIAMLATRRMIDTIDAMVLGIMADPIRIKGGALERGR